VHVQTAGVGPRGEKPRDRLTSLVERPASSSMRSPPNVNVMAGTASTT
jgi:hypothetical protein